MSFISYAQNFEDVMLWRALKHVERGFYIDVGANDPVTDSVTKAFYDIGWRGINIEPEEQWFEKLVSDRPRDINIQCAAGATEGELEFYVLPDTGLSTINQVIAEKHEHEKGFKKQVKTVPVRTLTDICLQYHLSPIHFLKIDVETAEKAVLEGLDLKKIRPWIIVIEATLPDSQEEDFEKWEHMLLGSNYQFVYFDGLNRYYVAKERGSLTKAFCLPINYWDDIILSESHHWCRNIFHEKNELKIQLGASEAVLADEQAHAQWLQNEWDVSKVRVEELVVELEGAVKNLEHLRIELGEKHEVWVASEAAVIHEQTHGKGLQNKSDASKVRIEQLVVELVTVTNNAEHLSLQLDEKQDEWVSSEAALVHEKICSQRLQNDWNIIKMKVDELNQSSHHWWLETERLNTQLQALYRSSSWRITWPLRKLMQFLQWMIVRPLGWGAALLKCSIRSFLIKTMAFALKNPALKIRTVAWLRKYPRFDTILRRLVQTRTSSSLGSVEGTRVASDLSHLTPSAYRIYRELKVVLEERSREDS